MKESDSHKYLDLQIIFMIFIITIAGTNIAIYDNQSLSAHIIATAIAVFIVGDVTSAVFFLDNRTKIPFYRNLKSSQQLFLSVYCIVIPITMLIASLGIEELGLFGLLGVFILCNFLMLVVLLFVGLVKI